MEKIGSAFALATATLALIAAPMVHAQTSTWTENDKSDPLHQISFKEFSLEGRFLIPPRQSNVSAPRLVLHCQPGRHGHGKKALTNGHLVEGWIATGAVLDSHVGQFGTCVPVEYRLDENKLQVDCWNASTDHSGIFLSDINLDNLLYGHLLLHKEGTNPQTRRIILGVSEYVAAQIQMQFDLPDSTEVADACGVIAHKR